VRVLVAHRRTTPTAASDAPAVFGAVVQRFAAQWPEWQQKQNASFPVGRIGRADEVAAACAFLLSADCPMMTGSSLTIDGGLSA
jgi:NAD(P)-dependent dehydrogenase (short-subunit alcohol dehydrogenase family)